MPLSSASRFARQQTTTKASNQLGGVEAPEQDAIIWHNAPSDKGMPPEESGGVKLCKRKLFATVAASMDDSDIAAEAGEVSEKTEEILSGHKRSGFFVSDTARFYPRSGDAAFRAAQAARFCIRKHPLPMCTCRATKEQAVASE